MTPYFFRVEHELLRSESFKALGGSAIKVYLTIGLYSDFGTDWAYPSIRTIAGQAGLSRQTVLAAIEELTRRGLLATSKSKGRSTAYKILRPAPERPRGHGRGKGRRDARAKTDRPRIRPACPNFFRGGRRNRSRFFRGPPQTGQDSLGVLAQFLGRGGREARPEQEPGTREDTNSIPIPGTPFRLSADGRLLVAVDLQELLTDQGIPRRLAEKLAAQKDPEAVAKVLLERALSPEPGQTSERAGVHPRGDRGRVRPAPAGGRPAGKSEAGAGGPFTHGGREDGSGSGRNQRKPRKRRRSTW